MSDQIQFKWKGLVIPISEVSQTKKGVVYTSYQVPDYSSGKRKRWTFADLEEAKSKAKELAEGTSTGQSSVLELASKEHTIRSALDSLEPTGIRLDRAAHIVAEAVKIVEADEILHAVKYWRDHRPDKKFTPITADLFVDKYLERQKHLSTKRQKALKSYLNALAYKFANRNLDVITTSEVKDFIIGKLTWGPKTKNEVKNAIALMYADAQERGHVAKGYDPSADVARLRLKTDAPGIYLPEQVRELLYCPDMEDELKIFLAVWFFAGCRKESIARMPLHVLKSALKTGSIKVTTEIDQKTGGRFVQLEKNLRLWISWYLNRHPDANGFVLPQSFSEGSRLDDLSKKIRRRAGWTEWEDNCGRHTYATMRLARGDTVQSVAKHAGNSLAQIQRFYWNRDEAITKKIAKEYFGIVPAGVDADMVPMKKVA